MTIEELIKTLSGKGPKPPMFNNCQAAAEQLQDLQRQVNDRNKVIQSLAQMVKQQDQELGQSQVRKLVRDKLQRQLSDCTKMIQGLVQMAKQQELGPTKVQGMIQEKLQILKELYTVTGTDWELEVHHVLTEPTCPTVVIRPEFSNINRYRIDCDTIEQGIERAVDMVYAEIVQRKKLEMLCPFSNSHDAPYEEWLDAHIRGEQTEFPNFYRGDPSMDGVPADHE